MSKNAAAPFWAMIPVLALASAEFIPPAIAADDLDDRVMETEVVPAWDGFHIGVGVGYGAAFHEGASKVDGGLGFDSGGGTGFFLGENLNGLGDKAGLVTVEAGMDFQLDERVVVGIFGDYTWANFDGKSGAVACVANVSPAADEFCAGSFTGAELENMWTVAGRLGFLSSPQTLWYGLAGWTRAGVDARTRVLIADGPDFIDAIDFSAGKDDDLDGITLGAGVEAMVTTALSLKLEYRYTDLGQLDFEGGGGGPGPGDISGGGAGIATQFDSTVQSIRGVLSWRFNRHCKIHDCAAGSPSGALTSPLSRGPEKQPSSGCTRVLRAPAKYSRETVAICELANGL